ncbi:MAG: Tn3 family transposase [Desulfobacterales bacterium]|nr:Tn3 family transposase [Desulfobacterales bacterium]
MPGLKDTVYPRFKKNINQKELDEIYTPSKEEISFSQKTTRGKIANLCFLIMLKIFQRLGYFVQINSVPQIIVNHIAKKLYIKEIKDLSYYSQSKTRHRHMSLIRSYLNIIPYGKESIKIIEDTINKAASIKEDLADIINIVIEELIHHRHELPAFSTLRRFAYKGRAKVNNELYRKITNNLSKQDKILLDSLFIVQEDQLKSSWQAVKTEAKQLTLKNLKTQIDHIKWLDQYTTGVNALINIPDVKIKQFSAEAKSMNAPRIARLKLDKKYALAITMIAVQKAIGLDDLGDMIIKLISKIHGKSRAALAKKNDQNQERTDKLVNTLHQILLVHIEYGGNDDRNIGIESIIGEKRDELIENCENHALYAGKNYFPFLWRFHASNRVALFDIINSVKLVSTTKDNGLIEAIEFIKYNRKSRKVLIDIDESSVSLPDLKWVSERWQKAIFDDNESQKVNRQYFELCIFYYLMIALKSGDICIEGSDKFSDYQVQLLSWDEYNDLIDQYGIEVNLPVETKAFMNHIRSWLENIAIKVDNSFPSNEYIRIENGKPVTKKSSKKPKVDGLEAMEAIIAQRLEPVTILDILNFTQQWLGWDKCFGPLSGYDSKLDERVKNYIVTVFCYGCNLGPIQTARSIKDFSRFQIARVNQRHVTEEKINEAIVKVINAYNLFDLPKIWGAGDSVSVDGTKWDLYEENLLSEYHIRYGGYGGIGYYHVSDQYIALFSHFIPCGVHEAVYILDGLLNNESDIQPDTIHGDTHSQSEIVFGLSYLLGIKLMPRIKNWKHLKFYKSRKELVYKHIEELFSDKIDWDLIEKYIPDMLRVALSIKAGKITASSILRKLGTYSRKNKLYQAFRELGRIVRTAFLLKYLNDKELREIIQAATCKSETFNKFAQWLLFGDEGIIKKNNRDEQRKVIKYNHFIANSVSLYNVVSLTKIINELVQEGYPVSYEMMASLSPYLTANINRFGDYHLNSEKKTVEIVRNLHLSELPN